MAQMTPQPKISQESLEAIDVKAENRRDELLSTTAVMVTNKDFSNRIINSPLEAVRFIPGISMVGYNEGGVPWEIKIRGFTGGHFSGVSFSLDGVQLNGPNGNFDAHFINPLEIESVEVVKGPSSIYFGLNSMGGSVAYTSIKEGDFTRLRASYGSYNDIQTAGILARRTGKFDHVYAFQASHSDGWRDNSEHDKKNISAQWRYVNERLTLNLNLRGYEHSWDQAGFLWSEENVSPRTAYNHDNGGEASRSLARFSADYRISDNSLLSLQGYYTELDFTRFQRAYRNLLWGNGNENNTQANNLGFRLMYNYRGPVWDRELSMALGLEYLHEDQEFKEWGFLPGSGKTKGAINSHYQNALTGMAILGEVNYQVMEPLGIRAGLRYDRYDGDREVYYANGVLANNHFDAKAREALSPKLGLLFTPLDYLELFANYGKTYDLPSVSGGNFFSEPTAEMPKSEQYEFGAKVYPSGWLALGAAYFLINTKNDLSTNVTTQRLENIGTTSRSGLELTAAAEFRQNWRFLANYTYQTAEYRNTFRTQRLSGQDLVMDMDGRRLDDTPRHIANAKLAYEPESGLGGWLSFWWYGDMVRNDFPARELERANRPDYRLAKPDTASLDLRLDYRFNENYRLTLDVLNVLDRRNIGFAAPTPTNNVGYVYSLQNPRVFYLGLEADWH
jgi:iron complex outermembrane receptor protein